LGGAVVIGWATLVFIGLAVLFRYPLLNGATHLSARLPTYAQDAADGHHGLKSRRAQDASSIS
jgi:hypothetical protein